MRQRSLRAASSRFLVLHCRGFLALLLAVAAATAAAGASTVCGAGPGEATPLPGEQFGCSVFIQGDVLAIGSNLGGLGQVATGSVTTFQRQDTGWLRGPKLVPADLHAGDQFGFSVAVSGDILAVGAPFADSDRAPGSGAVYVFRSDGAGGWHQEAKLAAAEGATGDRFGLSLAASGQALAVGAPFSSGAGSLAGAAYVFRTDGAGGWREEAALGARDAVPFANFGYSVSLDGGNLLTGAPFAGGFGGGAAGGGAAYLFSLGTNGSWTQQAKLTGQVVAAGDQFGASVALAGNVAVVGARRGAVGGALSAGAVYLFNGSAGSWQQTAVLAAPDPSGGALFGVSLALSGNSLLIGARGDSEAGSGAGAAYLFALDATTGRWLPVEKLTPSAASPGAAFGQSTGLSGSDIVVGGPLDNLPATPRAGAFALCQLPEPAKAKLAISLTDGVSQVLPGQTVVYTLTVSNSGSADVPAATVTDVFPPQLVNVRWCSPQQGPGCAQPQAGNIQDALDLHAGAQAVYTITAQVSANARTAVTDMACVAAPAAGVAPGSVCASDRDKIPSADLALALVAPPAVAMGGVLNYTLQVTNLGPSPATGVILTATLPPGLTALGLGGPGCTVVQGQLSCALGTLAPGRVSLTQLSFGVPACYQSPNPIVDGATVAGNEPDVNPSNNAAAAVTTLRPGGPAARGTQVCPADLAITFSRDPFIDGDQGTVLYTVAVQNTGTAGLNGARISSFFTPKLRRVLWCRGLGCAPGNVGPFADTLSLPAGAIVVYQVQLSVPTSFSNLLCYTVAATLPGTAVDPTSGDNISNELLCLTHDNIPCPQPPAGFCPDNEVVSPP